MKKNLMIFRNKKAMTKISFAILGIISLILAVMFVSGVGGVDNGVVYDETPLTLENKDPSNNWQIIKDNIYATLEYNSMGPEFEYSLEATGLEENTPYSLIYYADKPDRFNNWGGNNPGALITTFNSGTGTYNSGPKSIDLNMDLPSEPDENIDQYNYCDSDNYSTCYGAKIWLVPTEALPSDFPNSNPDIGEWDIWGANQPRILFETDLISYEVTECTPGDICEDPFCDDASQCDGHRMECDASGECTVEVDDDSACTGKCCDDCLPAGCGGILNILYGLSLNENKYYNFLDGAVLCDSEGQCISINNDCNYNEGICADDDTTDKYPWASCHADCDDEEDCNDKIDCTVDSCSTEDCQCDNIPTNSLCDNGLYCNGEETCGVDGCQAGTPIDCSHLNNQCNTGVCNEDTDGCVAEPKPEGTSCDDEEFCTVNDVCTQGTCDGSARDCLDNVDCTDDSCNEDTNSCDNIANDGKCDNGLWCDGAETCDAIDGCQAGTSADCSGNNIPGIAICTNDPDSNPFTWDYRDVFISQCEEETAGYSCTTGDTTITHFCDMINCNAGCEDSTDCEDTECDDLDRCYDRTYLDYHDVSNTCEACSCSQNQCTSYDEKITDNDNDSYDTECDGDCDDTKSTVNPGAEEICDGLDNDCDGVIPANENDVDNDGYMVCEGDCDDSNPEINPGATEVCNGIDDNCDGVIPANESDVDNDGYMVCEGDCDDSNPEINPRATEVCNGIDDDCDEKIDTGEGLQCIAIDLVDGCNLISLPLVPENTNIPEVLNSVTPEYVWAYKVNSESINKWSFYKPEEVVVGDLGEMIPGYGYYVCISIPEEETRTIYQNGEKYYKLGLLGIPMPPQVELTTGWNLIGHYGMNNVCQSDEIQDLSGGILTDLADVTLLGEDTGPDWKLKPTIGYWAFITGKNNLLYAPSQADYDSSYQSCIV